MINIEKAIEELINLENIQAEVEQAHKKYPMPTGMRYWIGDSYFDLYIASPMYSVTKAEKTGEKNSQGKDKYAQVWKHFYEEKRDRLKRLA